MSDWGEYLRYLDGGPHSVRLTTSNLAPRTTRPHPERTKINLNYTLWPFQEKILAEMGESTLILGLPTGLGKTYLAARAVLMSASSFS